MKHIPNLSVLIKTIAALACSLACFATTGPSLAYDAPKAAIAPVIDGIDNDAAWAAAKWQAIDKLILGEQPTPADFSGRFKVVWTNDRLHILGEFIDDVLIDTHADPLDSYWNDDTFEIFLDEDKSGGIHLNNYNAFAYHIALDNQAVDINSAGQPRLLNDHVRSAWKRQSVGPNKVIWEASIDLYPDTFKDTYTEGEARISPVTLSEGKELGFMLAYCDSDSLEREHFVSSYDIPAVNGDKNHAYIDASVFDTLTLVE